MPRQIWDKNWTHWQHASTWIGLALGCYVHLSNISLDFWNKFIHSFKKPQQFFWSIKTWMLVHLTLPFQAENDSWITIMLMHQLVLKQLRIPQQLLLPYQTHSVIQALQNDLHITWLLKLMYTRPMLTTLFFLNYLSWEWKVDGCKPQFLVLTMLFMW